jgi:hypothetical protein
MKKIYSILRQLTKVNQLTELYSSRLNPFVICYHQIEEHEIHEHITYLRKHFTIKKLVDINRDSYGCCAITVDDCIREDFIKSANIAEIKACPITYYLPTYYSANNLSIWPIKIKWAMKLKGKKNWRNEFSKLCQDWMQSGIQTNQLEGKADSIILHEYDLDVKKIPDSLRVISPEDIVNYKSNNYIFFESHSVTHPFLNLCTESEVKKELNESKTFIEHLTQKEVTSFCYPYGSRKIIGNNAPVLATKTYKNATTLVSGVITDNDLFNIPRIGIYPGDSVHELSTKIYHYQNLSLIGLTRT